MIHQELPISSYFKPGRRVHLVGIGGVSMSPLAEVLQGMGLKVQGSDMNESASVTHLRTLGIPIAIGHSAENLGDCDFVVRTAAARDSNPEISGAVARGIPVYERAQAWGAIMQRYENDISNHGSPDSDFLKKAGDRLRRTPAQKQQAYGHAAIAASRRAAS